MPQAIRLCLSYQGKTCGVCYRACPLPDVAIRVGRLEQPHVLEDCVGCGLTQAWPLLGDEELRAGNLTISTKCIKYLVLDSGIDPIDV